MPVSQSDRVPATETNWSLCEQKRNVLEGFQGSHRSTRETKEHGSETQAGKGGSGEARPSSLRTTMVRSLQPRSVHNGHYSLTARPQPWTPQVARDSSRPTPLKPQLCKHSFSTGPASLAFQISKQSLWLILAARHAGEMSVSPVEL